jgi:YegS/Rv2252/BmrU family lipid kinase
MAVTRTILIVNPCGGRRHGLAILDQIKPLFAGAGLELDVRVTQYAGHARDIARTLPLDDYRSLCVIGGDGTIHEVVSGLIERGASTAIPLGVIPGGTGNDVARQLKVSNAQEAVQRIILGHTRPLDVVKVETGGQVEYCLTIVGWVGVADINCTAERLRMFGPPRYALAALWQIVIAKPRRARLVLDDRIIEDDFQLVAACNTTFSGSGMRLAPRAKVDDGKIDVVILRRASRWRMLRLFARVFDGSHVDMPGVEYYQVHSLSIFADDGWPLDLDGEIKGTTPVTIQAIPGAVRVFC